MDILFVSIRSHLLHAQYADKPLRIGQRLANYTHAVIL